MGNVTDATWKEWQRRPLITVEDAEAVRDALPARTRWAIQDMTWGNPATSYRNGGPQSLVAAVSADYFLIKNLDVERGRVFTEQEEQVGAPVVVIGKETADTYFPNIDPLGREIKLEGLPFRVIGVLEKQGSTFGISLDRQVDRALPLGAQARDEVAARTVRRRSCRAADGRQSSTRRKPPAR